MEEISTSKEYRAGRNTGCFGCMGIVGSIGLGGYLVTELLPDGVEWSDLSFWPSLGLVCLYILTMAIISVLVAASWKRAIENKIKEGSPEEKAPRAVLWSLIKTPQGILLGILNFLILIFVLVSRFLGVADNERFVLGLFACVILIIGSLAYLVFSSTIAIIGVILGVISLFRTGEGFLHIPLWCGFLQSLHIHQIAVEWICAFMVIGGGIVSYVKTGAPSVDAPSVGGM